MESILNSIKKMLGIDCAETNWDAELCVHINTAFMTLTQLGIGDSSGFNISDSVPVWNDFYNDSEALEGLKSFVYMSVRLIFDPLPTAAATESYMRVIDQLTWRLKEQKEAIDAGI